MIFCWTLVLVSWNYKMGFCYFSDFFFGILVQRTEVLGLSLAAFSAALPYFGRFLKVRCCFVLLSLLCCCCCQLFELRWFFSVDRFGFWPLKTIYLWLLLIRMASYITCFVTCVNSRIASCSHFQDIDWHCSSGNFGFCY